jgi:hypothetical protein
MCCPSQRVGDLRESQGHFEMHFGGTSTGLTVHCVQYTESPCCTSSTIYLCDIQMPAECTLAGCTPRHIYIYTTRPYGARCSLARRTMRCGVYQYVRQECGRAKRSSCAALTSASPVVVLSFCLLPVGVYNAQSGAVIDWLFAFSGPFPVQPSPHTGRTKSTLGRWYCLRTLGS